MTGKAPTVQELKQQLAEAERKEKQQLEKETKQYLSKRDMKIKLAMQVAVAIAEELKSFKSYMDDIMEDQKEELAKYGKLNAKSKGGFALEDSDKLLKITRNRSVKPSYDERFKKGVTLLERYLEMHHKKKDEDLYAVLMGFLAKDDNGDFDQTKVLQLLSKADRFDHEDWNEGVRLIRIGHSVGFRKYSYDFQQKNTDGDYEKVQLNFSSL